jgi:hypothetical protein
VNAAARMETTSEKMKIQCSEMSYRLLRDAPNYQFSLSERGGVEVKGKGRYVVNIEMLFPETVECNRTQQSRNFGPTPFLILV